jgi:hypothetical protein
MFRASKNSQNSHTNAPCRAYDSVKCACAHMNHTQTDRQIDTTHTYTHTIAIPRVGERALLQAREQESKRESARAPKTEPVAKQLENAT